MILTLVLLAIGALLFLIIAYNIVQQYKQKVEQEKRSLVAKQKVIIDETDELLLNANRIPYSKTLVLLMQQRIHDALQLIQDTDPSYRQLTQRLVDVKNQIANIKENYTAQDDKSFRAPSNDQQTVQMMKVLKKLRAVLRAEYNKGKIDPQGYVAQDRRLEVMLLKLNLESLFKRAATAKMTKQWGTAKQQISKGIKVLSAMSDRDNYLNKKLQELQEMQKEIDTHLQQASKQELQDIQDKETNELDVLFQPKKKW
ncbi:DNA repair protein [Dongshaea marina]|uniref:DNA repair protein n=1 Tax=Dongshaea marina TaxID=2047966 RepID=UPI000D3E2A21|nr:DNA repair protein [Dongshaea marina]